MFQTMLATGTHLTCTWNFKLGVTFETDRAKDILRSSFQLCHLGDKRSSISSQAHSCGNIFTLIKDFNFKIWSFAYENKLHDNVVFLWLKI